MSTKIKLTDQDMKAQGFQWKLGVPAPSLSGEDGFYYFYNDLLLGLFFNPLHTNIQNPRAFAADVSGKSEYDGLKYGYTEATLTKELSISQITPQQIVTFAALCAATVPDSWGEAWLAHRAAEDAARLIESSPTAATTMAAFAAEMAVKANANIDLIAIAHQALK